MRRGPQISQTAEIELSDADREALQRLAEGADATMAARARIVLAAAEGRSRAEIAREVGVSRPTVTKWLERFADDGVDGLATITEGRGRPPSIPPETVRLILETPDREPPPAGKRRWTVRAMAERAGVSLDTVQRLWRAHGVSGEVPADDALEDPDADDASGSGEPAGTAAQRPLGGAPPRDPRRLGHPVPARPRPHRA